MQYALEMMLILPDSKLGNKHSFFYILCVSIFSGEAKEDFPSFTDDSYAQIILFHAFFAWEKTSFVETSLFSWYMMVKKDFLHELYEYMSNEENETILEALGRIGEGGMSLI